MDYRVLGPLEVSADGTRVEIGSGRQRALLALLLLRRNEVVPMDRIVDALWGERPPPTAAKVVQGYISQLRKSLGDGALITRAPGYELRVAAHEIDLERFDALVDRAQTEPPDEAARTLRDALALWRGAPLTDVAYDSFAQSEIARLEELRIGAVEDRIDADLVRGRRAQLVPELEALVREHPLRERLRAQLMLALYRTGRQPDALDVYADYRRRLVDELGLEPSAEIQELQRQVLARDPALGRARKPPLATATRRAPVLLVGGALLIAAAVVSALLLVHTSSAVTIRSNDVVAIDPHTARVVAAAAVGQTPSRVVTGDGAVWVLNADDRTISKVDPQGRTVRTVSPGADLNDIAAGAGAVWATSGANLTRLDPQSLTIARSIPLGRTRRNFVTAGTSSVWVTGGQDERLLVWRIDPQTNRVVRATSVRAATAGIWNAQGFGSLWVRGDTDLLRLNGETGAVEASVDLPTNFFVFEDTGGIAVDGHAVWVTSVYSKAVWEIDPGTDTPAGSVSIGGVPSGVAVGGGSLWVTNRSDGALLQIDPVSRRIKRVIRLGHSPNGVAYGFGRVWVSVD